MADSTQKCNLSGLLKFEVKLSAYIVAHGFNSERIQTSQGRIYSYHAAFSQISAKKTEWGVL
jgi:hypothetical protein